MSLIEWSESHSVGVPAIDDQHKQLVSLTNSLFEAIMRDEGQFVLGGILAELARYAEYHFDYEEQLLADRGYPEELLAPHQEKHRKLTARAHEMLARHKERSATLDLEVYAFLRDWMTEHMIETDSQYADFLASHPAN